MSKNANILQQLRDMRHWIDSKTVTQRVGLKLHNTRTMECRIPENNTTLQNMNTPTTHVFHLCSLS